MRFLGEIAGEKLQLSSQNICACFHAVAVPDLFIYLFICTQSDEESICHTALCSRSVMGCVWEWESAVCFSAHLQCWPHIPLAAPSVDMGAAGPWGAVLSWAERRCRVLWGGWAAPLSGCSTRAVCWSEVKAVIHEAIVLFLSMLSCTLMSLAWSARIGSQPYNSWCTIYSSSLSSRSFSIRWQRLTSPSLHPEPGHLVPAVMSSSPPPQATQSTSLWKEHMAVFRIGWSWDVSTFDSLLILTVTANAVTHVFVSSFWWRKIPNWGYLNTNIHGLFSLTQKESYPSARWRLLTKQQMAPAGKNKSPGTWLLPSVCAAPSARIVNFEYC